jgi:hypothetical protein
MKKSIVPALKGSVGTTRRTREGSGERAAGECQSGRVGDVPYARHAARIDDRVEGAVGFVCFARPSRQQRTGLQRVTEVMGRSSASARIEREVP